jgi:signal transduction histidine kinase
MVERSVRIQVRKEIGDDLHTSVVVFQDFEQQREISLASSAELLANLPSLKALMTTHDAVTVQDASASIWRLAPSDVFILADPGGNILAVHATMPGITRTITQELLKASLGVDQPSFWWFGAGHLYQVFLRPIYFCAPEDGSVLGVLGVGHEISQTLAREVSRIASSEVAFFYGNQLIASTLLPEQETQIPPLAPSTQDLEPTVPSELTLNGETFAATTVVLAPAVPPFVHLSVLKSYDQASIFLDRLNRLLLALGLVAIVAGSLAVFFISFTFTKPLANLVSGVRALENGDFSYPLTRRGGDETAELTAAFDRMRATLQRTQRDLLATERLATIGRTASSISHDLRHPLTAVVANAEFLCDHDLGTRQREELYTEIRTAVDQITDLVESLLEFAQPQESLRKVFGRVDVIVEEAIHKVQAHPEFHFVDITIAREGACVTSFDQKRVERALVNLVLNACEFVPRDDGKISISLRQFNGNVEIRVVDNGPGIPEPIREKLFEPFVSYGKQNGTGLGLAIAHKIFQDHGGDACLESSGPGRTVFKLTLPLSIGGEFSETHTFRNRLIPPFHLARNRSDNPAGVEGAE